MVSTCQASRQSNLQIVKQFKGPFGLLQRKIYRILHTTNIAYSIRCEEMKSNVLFGILHVFRCKEITNSQLAYAASSYYKQLVLEVISK